MRNQGADTHGLQRVLTKMLNRHWKLFEKFNVSLEQIALDISSSGSYKSIFVLIKIFI